MRTAPLVMALGLVVACGGATNPDTTSSSSGATAAAASSAGASSGTAASSTSTTGRASSSGSTSSHASSSGGERTGTSTGRDSSGTSIGSSGGERTGTSTGGAGGTSSGGTTGDADAGTLFTQGASIVDSQGNPFRIAATCMVCLEDVDDYGVLADLNWQSVVNILLSAGINTLRISTSDYNIENDPPVSAINLQLNPTFAGLDYDEALQELMRIGSGLGLHFIVVSHMNEPNVQTGGQQVNGIWYDLGGASDGTDGVGAPVDNSTTYAGTVSDADWISIWQTRATLFKGLGVIGYDLRNEPLMSQSIGGYNSIGSTWGGYGGGQVGGDQDLRDAYIRAGNAIHAIDPDPLIICMFPADGNGYDGRVLGWTSGTSLTWPVTLTAPNKVVYSAHEYPTLIGGETPDTGSGYVAAMDGNWGFLYDNDIAPVWIGEMGSGLRGQNSQDWANTIIPYLDGAAGSGMTLPAGNLGVNWEWFPLMRLQFDWNTDGEGILTADGTGVDAFQQGYWGQMVP